MAEIRERVCITLTTLSGIASGREVIVKCNLLLNNLAKLMDDKEETIRFKVAILLETISRTWFAADYLVDAGFIKLILDRISKEMDNIKLTYLEALMFLMYAEGKDEALSLGAFDLFVLFVILKFLTL